MPKSILWLASDRAGCGVYRCFVPGLSLDVKHGGQFDNHFTFHNQITSPDPQILDGIDLVVFQRAVGTYFLDLMREARARDIPTVFEMDDDLFNVPRANPAAWFWSKKQVQKILRQQLDAVDAIIVSTPPLRDIVIGLGQPASKVEVCFNHLHPDVWGASVVEGGARHASDGHLVIGWQGSVTHDVDFQVAIPALRRILDEFPEVILRLFGSVPASLQGKIEPKRFQWVNGVAFERYPATLAFLNFDIGIAPITPSKFNASKSNLKYLEYCALGVPCVASTVYPYATTIQHGVSGFLAATEEEWYQGLRALVTNPELRATMGALAKRWAWESWGSARARDWDRLFTHLLRDAHVHLPEFRRNG